MALKIISNNLCKLLGYGAMPLALLNALSLAALSTCPAGAVVPPAASPSSINYSYMGDLSHAAQIPCGFGPFKAKASTVGVYRGRLQIFANDLKGQPLFLVIRIHEDKTHSFGWVRAYVNKELVATEAQLKESRIVTDLSKVLKPGYADISIMGAAYPDTSMDFYVVPRDSVLSAIQGKPLGKVLYAVGPFQVAGKEQELFSQSFELTADEAKSRLLLSARLFAQDKPLGWERLFLNGQLLAAEKDFSPDGATTMEITGKATEGINKIVMHGGASAGTPAAWYLMQMPVLRDESTRGGVSSPAITSVEPAELASANETIQINGRNFDPDPSNNKVMLDDKILQVQSSSKTKLTVLLPTNVQSGDSNLVVEVADEPSDSFPLKVLGQPHITSASVSQCPAGYDFIIYGDNFPESLDKVKVSIGSAPATVLASCKQSLLVKMPTIDQTNQPKDAGGLPVKVSVARLESKEPVNIRLGASAIKSAKSGLSLVLVSAQNESKTFDEKKWRSLIEKAEASSKESNFEAAEFYFNESLAEASRAQTISQPLIDSLNGLSACYQKQNLTDAAKECAETAKTFAGVMNPAQ